MDIVQDPQTAELNPKCSLFFYGPALSNGSRRSCERPRTHAQVLRIHINAKSRHMKTTHGWFVIQDSTQTLWCVGSVLICRRCIQGRVRKKRDRKLIFIQYWKRSFPHTSGVSPSNHTACTGRSSIRPCSSSYLEEDFTHFVHFLPVWGITDQLHGVMCIWAGARRWS